MPYLLEIHIYVLLTTEDFHLTKHKRLAKLPGYTDCSTGTICTQHVQRRK